PMPTLAEVYARLPDLELAALLNDPTQLTPEALAIAQKEAESRGGLEDVLDSIQEPSPTPAPLKEGPNQRPVLKAMGVALIAITINMILTFVVVHDAATAEAFGASMVYALVAGLLIGVWAKQSKREWRW